ncbi:cob(I)yrinic acid a,c-diamide adenosyltransferase [Candidatus Gottesmanbacteria bacterium]|nr:cob(I)yrinic acid a,c-diamide adenosyltransferase [Candidatus Gottesmanbacteria bacterium]
MPIYTRTGDTGSTSLFGGKRVLKCEELVDVYGSIDELNSWVGLLASQLNAADVRQFLETVQSDLFTVGSSLAGSRIDLRVLDQRVKEMEARIDALEKELPPIRNFILPGGNQLGAYIHLARSVCRRVERQTVALAQKNNVDSMIIKYLNRLSDLFFVLARFINKQSETPEIIWKGNPAKS